jgi:hypothetical protein
VIEADWKKPSPVVQGWGAAQRKLAEAASMVHKEGQTELVALQLLNGVGPHPELREPLAGKPAIRQNYGPTRTQLFFHCGNRFLLDRGGSPILDFVVLFCVDHINATTQSVTHIAILDRLQLAASSINTANRNMFLNIFSGRLQLQAGRR